ncbi:hypothetical protein HMPREF1608_01882 [Escherichia coli 908525]|nr:hypothetical protein HMPREF1596_05273 [Escherichia coli 907700]ESD58368.1 hypothetical protein HMPREF1607_02501 [Escherichia coli 908524]ESD74259.1 hypothetical protein HMPREF1608_01882 [Escherichia coli 908525]ESE18404.1 hypothetical protein HMPREF1618_02988 [Escherichia coli 908691]
MSASLFHTRHTSSRICSKAKYDEYRVMLSWFEFFAENRKMAWILSRKQLKVI